MVKQEETNIHIGLGIAESVEAKKEILRGQIDMLKAVARLEEYKKLRNQELAVREKLRREWIMLKRMIKELISELPETPGMEKMVVKERVKTITSTRTLQSDLESIQEKLARLG